MSGTMRVIHEEGDRFTVEAGAHLITVDQPVGDGGTDLGPNPTELFVASLASCTAFYGRRFLHRHGLPDDVTVDVEWSMGSSPPRVKSIEMLVAAPGLPLELGRRFTKVIEHCTVHNTLIARPEVTIALEAGNLGRAEEGSVG